MSWLDLMRRVSLDNHEAQNRLDAETNTTTEIGDRLIRKEQWMSLSRKARDDQVITVLMPGWYGHDDWNERGSRFERDYGPVVSFEWSPSAISADVETTAAAFREMQELTADVIIQESRMYPNSDIRVIGASSGVANVTGALQILLERGETEILEKTSGTFMAATSRFAPCYMNGARTEHIGDAVRDQGYTMEDVAESFRHMDPIEHLPALKELKRVTVLYSPSDTYLPAEGTLELIAAMKDESMGDRLTVKSRWFTGHTGMMWGDYILGGGLNSKRSFGAFGRRAYAAFEDWTINKTMQLIDAVEG